MSKQVFDLKLAEEEVAKLDSVSAIEEIVSVNLDEAVDDILAKTEREKASKELLRAQLDMLIPDAGHIAKCVGIDEADVNRALEIVLDKYLGDKVTGYQYSTSAGMVMVTVLLNSEYSLKDEFKFAEDKEVRAVTLDSITGLDGTEIEFTESGGKPFVPSFDKKEDGKWILHYFVRDVEDRVILKLVASYDHNTKVVKADGEYWERCAIRIDLK